MGEIGIDRETFFHELKWWEINSIISGYRKRDRLKHQLLAEVVYAAIHANPYRKDNGKSLADMFPQIFEEDDDYEEPDPISEEDRQQLLADMAAWQQQLDKERSDEG